MQSIAQFRSFKRNAQRQLVKHGHNDKGDEDPEKCNRRESYSPDVPVIDDSVPGDLSRILTGEHEPLPPLQLKLTGIITRHVTGAGSKIYVVGYEGGEDNLNPHNWSNARRWYITCSVGLITFIVGIASSIDSIATPLAAKDLHVSELAASLGTALYLVGFGIGALMAGPFSETFGRNPVYIVTLFIFMIWEMATALAPNFGSQITFRFLAGFFGASPLVVAGGSLADVWDPVERTLAFPVFANAAFLGPLFGPVLSGFIGQSLGWRWCDWITLIGSFVIILNVVFFLPETYAPMLLKWKAEHLRQITGVTRYKAPIEIRDTTFLHRVGIALYRPCQITLREPIVLLIGLYLLVVYVVLFGFLTAYPFIFGRVHGFNYGLQGLSFMGLVIGLCLCTCTAPYIYRHYRDAIYKSPTKTLPPERRLIQAMLFGWCIPVSLFWMAWTSRTDISVWGPLIASVLTGLGILSVFISCCQYIIDSYEIYAASALASVTFIRYVASGGAVVFAFPMFDNLGVPWALTILAIISTVLVPIPFIFHRYGRQIRARSRFAKSDLATPIVVISG